jgi:NTE family protein
MKPTKILFVPIAACLFLSACFFAPAVKYEYAKKTGKPGGAGDTTTEPPTVRTGKKALIISGGGVKGSFAVGVLKQLMLYDTNLYKKYDIFGGTSTGSLIAPLLSVGWIDTLTDLYTNPEKVKTYYQSNGTLVDVLRRGSALFNTDGLREKVRAVIDSNYKRLTSPDAPTLLFATVSMTSGDLIYFSNKHLVPQNENAKRFAYQKVNSDSEMVDAIMASANQPVYAELQWMNNEKRDKKEQFGDGGVRDYLPIQAAIDLGATEIDVIQCSPFFFDETAAYNGVLTTMFRTLDLITDQVGQGNIDYSKKYLDQIPIDVSHLKKIRLFRPTKSGYGSAPDEIDFPFLSSNLAFDPARMMRLWKKGGEIVRKIHNGEITSPNEAYEEYP